MEKPVSRRTLGYRDGETESALSPPDGAEYDTRGGALLAVRLGGARYPARVAADGSSIHVWLDGETYELTTRPSRARAARSAGEEGMRAPMPGRILRVLVSEGERVARGATLLILEAMKMEHEIKASRDGVVVRLPFRPGEQVEAGAVLVDFTG
jgi:3-methylcrotonyl-CoA carboxylase alpha subunit